MTCEAKDVAGLQTYSNIIDFNKAISKCAKGKHWQVALQFFNELEFKSLQATVVTYNSAIHACAQAATWESAIWLLRDLEDEAVGLQVNVISYSTAISSCEKSGQWQVALFLLKTLKQKKLQLNVIACNAVMSACAKGSLADLAELDRMLKKLMCFFMVFSICDDVVSICFEVKNGNIHFGCWELSKMKLSNRHL